MAKDKPEQDNLEDVLKKIKSLQGQSEQKLTDEEIKAYIKSENEKKVDPKSKAAKQIAKLMAGNPKVRNELMNDLPKAVARGEYKETVSKLRADAGRSGVDKMKNDFFGAKKRAAKRELERIAQDKRKEAGDQAIDKSKATASISTGRGRHALTSIVNEQSLGSHEERHNAAYPLPKDNRLKIIDDCETKDGVLKGAVYGNEKIKDGDKLIKDGDKVVLFFSGSGGPAGQYAPQVIQPYLDMGAKVVTMDYRGYGDSETHNSRGKKVGTPLSEKSLYKDGKAMLDYVMKELKVKPENIILHGYSMGGAVASKVAADFAQEQQKRALEEGRSVKKLGGVVLHSPISSLYEAASEVSNKFKGAGAWMFGGGYNTRSHMRRLHQFDPNIPVHYVSGDYGAEDHLDIDRTGIHQDLTAKFENSSSYRGKYGHTGENITEADEKLALLVKEGRAAKLNEQTKQTEQPTQNKQSDEMILE